MRILALMTDAFGGHGGIAQYNRDLLTALCSMPEVDEVVAVPRTLRFAPGKLPDRLRYHPEAAGGKFRFAIQSLLVARGRFDMVICGHINLLPLSAVLAYRHRAPLVLQVHGIDAWTAHQSLLVRRILGKVSAVWSVSHFTKEKVLAWSRINPLKFTIIPNSIDLDHFGPGPKSPVLVQRYGLDGRKVLMTLCRLPGAERYKGVDEVLDLMPRLLLKEPHLIYLVAGEGDDRPRLEQKAAALGIADHVRFTGFVPEDEKTDHYRLADAFVMPGRGEGFGIVFLEALACGLPVLASELDGSREAVMSGELGRLVDPRDATALEETILEVLSDPHQVPAGLAYFSREAFATRVAGAVRSLRGIE